MSRRYHPEVYTVVEIRALLKTFSKRYPTSVRNAAIIAVGYAGGLRCAEVLSLGVKDIRQDGRCFVQHGKGDKSRTVYLSDSATAYVERWKATRKGHMIYSSPLFCTLKSTPVLSSYVRAMMSRAGKRAGFTKRCHFHALRHSFAIEMARAGTEYNVIRKALGHLTLAATTSYLDHINEDDLREASESIPEF